MTDTMRDPKGQLAEVMDRLAELTDEVVTLRAQIGRNDKERARLTAERTSLEQLIAARRDKVIVSDHAVIRYLERRHGFDFEDVRDEIVTPALIAAVNVGAAGIKVDGGTFKIRGRTVVTYVRGTKDHA